MIERNILLLTPVLNCHSESRTWRPIETGTGSTTQITCDRTVSPVPYTPRFEPEDSLGKCLRSLLVGQHPRLWYIKDGKVGGVLSIGDILKFLLEDLRSTHYLTPRLDEDFSPTGEEIGIEDVETVLDSMETFRLDESGDVPVN